MKVCNICKSYFSGFQEIFKFKDKDSKTQSLNALKIISYFTVLIPLAFAIAYFTASLYGRISKKQYLFPFDQKLIKKSQDIIFNKSNIKLEISDKQNRGNRQPEIVSDSWGQISLKVNGVVKNFKDVIILPSEAQEIAEEWNWQWDSESMHHHPGIRISDIDSLILSKTSKPDVIILTQGRGHGGKRDNPGPGILEVAAEVKDYIEKQGFEIYILKTVAAIEKYNEIRSQGGKRIAALIHTTC